MKLRTFMLENLEYDVEGLFEVEYGEFGLYRGERESDQ